MGFVWIWARSCAVPTGPSARGGTQPNASRSVVNAQAERHPWGLGEGFCLAHARASEVKGPPTHRFLPRTALSLSSSFYHPLAKIPAARARGRRLRALGLVVPSERPWATQRPRSGGVQAPWTVEGRADRSSAPAGSCHRALGGGAAPGACAAWAARARPWERASTTHEDLAPPSTTALHRPSDALRAARIAGL